MNAPKLQTKYRLLETLSGWRLVAFFVVLLANLGLFAFLSLVPPNFSNEVNLIWMSIVAAQVCVVTLGVSSTSIPLSMKIAIAGINSIWAVKIVDGLWGFDIPLGFAAISYPIATATVLCIAHFYTGLHQAIAQSFQLRDLLIGVTVFGIGTAIWQSLGVEWRELASTNKMTAFIGWGFAHVGWTLLFLQLCVTGISIQKTTSPLVNRFVVFVIGSIIVFLIDLICAEFVLAASNRELFITTRASFIIWLIGCLVPVVGLSAKAIPSGKEQGNANRTSAESAV